MKDPMFTPCSYWAELLTTPPDDLSTSDRQALEAHLATCPACALIHAEFRMVRALISTLPAPPLPPGLPPQLAQRIEEEAEPSEALQPSPPRAITIELTFEGKTRYSEIFPEDTETTEVVMKDHLRWALGGEDGPPIVLMDVKIVERHECRVVGELTLQSRVSPAYYEAFVMHIEGVVNSALLQLFWEVMICNSRRL